MGQVQLLADRINLAVPAPPPPADLRYDVKRSPVVTVAINSPGHRTAVEVTPECRVFRTGGVVRRATPGIFGQVTSATP